MIGARRGGAAAVLVAISDRLLDPRCDRVRDAGGGIGRSELFGLCHGHHRGDRTHAGRSTSCSSTHWRRAGPAAICAVIFEGYSDEADDRGAASKT